MRRPHILRRNESCETVQQAVWFDTETSQHTISPGVVEHHLTFGWAAYRRRLDDGVWSDPQWHRYEDPDSFWCWLESKVRAKTRLYAFCHNTSFDLAVLDCFRHLPVRGWKLTTAVIDAPPTILRWRKDGSSLHLLDTLNLWRLPLKKIGEQIGLPKLDMPEQDDTAEAWDRYAKRDVEVIMEACLRWWESLQLHDLGGFAPTLAGQAMRAFRHRFMRHTILIDADDRALALSREGYSGGWVECFRIGHFKHGHTLLDVNSMYPAVMASNDYPTVLTGYTKRATVQDLGIWLRDRAVMARVVLDTRMPCYPVRAKERLVFPVGRFRTVLSSPELHHALAHGHIESVEEVAVYDRAPIFHAFVSEMYGRRRELLEQGKDTDAWVLKILLNSLYGKFGQRGLVWEAVEHTDSLRAIKWEELDLETGDRINWRQFGGLVQRQEREQESRESHPAIAAHVTAYARMLLWRLIRRAGRRNVVYVDTDSLLVNWRGYRRLRGELHPTRLGALKEEWSGFDVEIWGPKDYRFGSRERHKGVRSNARWLDANTVEQERWSSLRGLVRFGRVDAPTTATVTKRLARVYGKGRVGRWGHVHPFEASKLLGDP